MHAWSMEQQPVDLDLLIGSWRGAFEAAQDALRAGSHDLPRGELRERAGRLADERVETVRLLDALARDRHSRHLLVRLVTAPWEAKRLLGLPGDVEACVFNVDGVLIGSAAIHADVWRRTFDELLSRRIGYTNDPLAHFDVRVDYPRYIHGRPRLEAVRDFLASRGISLPEGSPDDPPGTDTVHGLANRKNSELRRRLYGGGISPFEGARLYLELAHDAAVQCAVVSGSTNTQIMVDRAQLTGLIDDCVDGNTMLAEHLNRKPAPDMLVAACRHLGVAPEHAAVFETTREGIDAGRAGGFELVVGVGRGNEADALRAEGADLVVADLGEILDHALAA
jgi:beta-phosphoglucomutase-like phosphatase (HAD superfamily)